VWNRKREKGMMWNKKREKGMMWNGKEENNKTPKKEESR
jgi:hypothetical protein